MAGITNPGFRRLCREQGAGFYVCEMITSRGLVETQPADVPHDRLRRRRAPALAAALRRRPGDGRGRRCGSSSSATSPTTSTSTSAARSPRSRGAAAARRCRTSGGCSRRSCAPPSTTPGRVPGHRQDAHRHRRRAPHLPRRRAPVAADAGVAAVALHARTAAQRYSGTADWSAIARLRDALPAELPVLGNGDIFCADGRAARWSRRRAATASSSAAGCLGRPWLFGDLEAAFAGRPLPAPPSARAGRGDHAPPRRAALRAHGRRQGHPRHAQAHRLVPQGLPGRARRRAAGSGWSSSLDELDELLADARPRPGVPAPTPRARADGRARRAASCCPSAGWTTRTTRRSRSGPSWSTPAAEAPTGSDAITDR